jgi:N-acetylneuraminic acid mutarotase
MKKLMSYFVLACLVAGIGVLNGCKKEPDPISMPAVSTASVESTSNTVVVKGVVISEGGAEVTARGVCWSTSHEPTISYSKTEDGTGEGAFLSYLNDLVPNTTYYVRAYATNIEGTSYGNEITFSTGPASPVTLTTSVVVLITGTTAVSGGSITNDGGGQITSRGICWSTVQNPTTADRTTINGAHTGVFTSIMDNLTPNTTYYVRAYATNEAGTSYGNEITFLTSPGIPPTLTTFFVGTTATSAVAGGNITDIGDVGEITDRGICWSTSQLPTIDDEKLSNGMGAGNFTVNLINLNPGTTYYIRAFAIYRTDVFYGDQLIFTTSPATGIPGADFPGEGLYNLVGFAIGAKAYIGLGINNSDFPGSDFWEWDPASRLWTRVANFPGYGGGYVDGFSIGTKGYITTISSFEGIGYLTNEFWEYDPATNSWTQKASLPTTPARGNAVVFSVGTKGYIGIGSKEQYTGLPVEYYSDFWEWDQATDVWTKKADFPGNARSGAVGFSIGNRGYVGTGLSDNSLTDEFWEWDQSTDVWTKKADFAGGPRSSAFGFSIGNKGYIGTGYNGDETSYLSQDVWEWDQMTNEWTKVADYVGGPRAGAISVSIGNKAYIGTGSNYNSGNLKDFWEYDPNL